jgi:hypothetical protein
VTRCCTFHQEFLLHLVIAIYPSSSFPKCILRYLPERLLLTSLIDITTCFINTVLVILHLISELQDILYPFSTDCNSFIILYQIHLVSLPDLRDSRDDRHLLSFNSHQRPRLPGGGRRQDVFPYISITGRGRGRRWTSSSSASVALTDLRDVRFGFRIKSCDRPWEHSRQYHISWYCQ